MKLKIAIFVVLFALKVQGQTHSPTFWSRLNQQLFGKQNQLELNFFLGDYYFDNLPIKMDGITGNYLIIKDRFEDRGIRAVNRNNIKRLMPFYYRNGIVPYPHSLFYKRLFPNNKYFTAGYWMFGRHNEIGFKNTEPLNIGNISSRHGTNYSIGIGTILPVFKSFNFYADINLVMRQLIQHNVSRIIPNIFGNHYWTDAFMSKDYGYGLGFKAEYLMFDFITFGTRLNFNHLIIKDVQSSPPLQATGNFVIGYKF